MRSTTKRVTLKDVAALAQVSQMTASAVLSRTGSKNVRVSESTRNKVILAAKKLEYHPNVAAQMLANHKSSLIGVLLDSQAPLATFRILQAMESKLFEADYRVMVGQFHSANCLNRHARKIIDDFVTYNVAAVAAFSHEYPENTINLTSEVFENVPNAVFLRSSPIEDGCCVRMDVAAGINEAYDYLHNKGRSRIALFSVNSNYTSLIDRKSAFVVNQMRYNKTLNDKLIYLLPHQNPTVTDIKDFYRQLLIKEKVDAVICSNDELAASLIRGLLAHGVRIPEDVAIIGQDNDKICDYAAVPISTIDPQPQLTGTRFAELILSRINGSMGGVTVSVKPKLMLRESA